MTKNSYLLSGSSGHPRLKKASEHLPRCVVNSDSFCAVPVHTGNNAPFYPERQLFARV